MRPTNMYAVTGLASLKISCVNVRTPSRRHKSSVYQLQPGQRPYFSAEVFKYLFRRALVHLARKELRLVFLAFCYAYLGSVRI